MRDAQDSTGTGVSGAGAGRALKGGGQDALRPALRESRVVPTADCTESGVDPIVAQGGRARGPKRSQNAHNSLATLCRQAQSCVDGLLVT